MHWKHEESLEDFSCNCYQHRLHNAHLNFSHLEILYYLKCIRRVQAKGQERHRPGTAFLCPRPPSWQLYWTWRKAPECSEEESWCGNTLRIYETGGLSFTIWFSGTSGYSFTVISWTALRTVKVLQSPEMLAKVQVSAPGEGDPPWEKRGPPAPQVKATLPGDSSFRLQGRHTWR